MSTRHRPRKSHHSFVLRQQTIDFNCETCGRVLTIEAKGPFIGTERINLKRLSYATACPQCPSTFIRVGVAVEVIDGDHAANHIIS